MTIPTPIVVLGSKPQLATTEKTRELGSPREIYRKTRELGYAREEGCERVHS